MRSWTSSLYRASRGRRTLALLNTLNPSRTQQDFGHMRRAFTTIPKKEKTAQGGDVGEGTTLNPPKAPPEGKRDVPERPPMPHDPLPDTDEPHLPGHTPPEPRTAKEAEAQKEATEEGGTEGKSKEEGQGDNPEGSEDKPVADGSGPSQGGGDQSEKQNPLNLAWWASGLDSKPPEPRDLPLPANTSIWSYPQNGIIPFLARPAMPSDAVMHLTNTMEPVDDTINGAKEVLSMVMKMWREGDKEGLSEILHPTLLDQFKAEQGVEGKKPFDDVLSKEWEVMASQITRFDTFADYREDALKNPKHDMENQALWIPRWTRKPPGIVNRQEGIFPLLQSLQLYFAQEKRLFLRMHVVFQAVEKEALAAMRRSPHWSESQFPFSAPLARQTDSLGFYKLVKKVEKKWLHEAAQGKEEDGDSPDSIKIPSKEEMEGFPLRFFSLTFEKEKLVKAPPKKEQSGESSSNERGLFSLFSSPEPRVYEDREFGWRIVDINSDSLGGKLSFDKGIQIINELYTRMYMYGLSGPSS